MSQSNSQHGDFVAFMNRDKQPGDKRPAFEGRISKPGVEDKHPLVLWAHEYTDTKTGEVKVMFSGLTDAVATNAPAANQIAALVAGADKSAAEATLGNLTLAPRQVVLFPNGFKNEPTTDGTEPKNRPDFWGAYNPGDGSPIVRTSVWLKQDRNGRAYLSGATSYPIPGKSETEMQAAPAKPSLADQPLIPFYGGEAIPPKAKSKGRGRGE